MLTEEEGIIELQAVVADNHAGNCPCSDCGSKSNCEDLCLSWYEWDDSI